MEIWAGEADLECCKLSLLKNVGQNSEDENVDRNVDGKGKAQVSAVNKDFTDNSTSDHVCYALAKKIDIGCEILWETNI